MSFILDALKKSEIERQRQTVPGLMDTRIATGRRRLPLWAIFLAVLLAVNVIVLSIILMRSSTPTSSASSKRAAGESNAPIPARSAAADHFSPLDPSPVYAPEVPLTAADGTQATAGPQVRTGPGGAISVSPLRVDTASRSTRRPDPLLTGEQSNDDSDEVLPTINEMNLTGTQAIPEMHLDVHVYATKPSDRFVYINMRKYHEGNTLQEGPTLERIRRDGVILNLRGLRFVVPRQS